MLRNIIQTALACALVVASGLAAAHDDGPARATRAQAGPGDGYAFPLAKPGSYRLPPIKEAGSGRVLDDAGASRDLAGLLRGHITVLAFFYTRCGDICPTANLQLSVLQDLAADEPDVSKHLQLVSMSFDPEHDTPAVMAEHAALWRSDKTGAPAWRFLTSPNQAALAPILAAYNQAIGPKSAPDATGGPLHHIFRGFLIDPSGRIRNIYSLDFLDPELVLNDVKTLILSTDEDDRTTSRTR